MNQVTAATMEQQQHQDEEQKIRLRLHYRGQFVRANGEWKYVNGEVFNESISARLTYADLMLRLNQKLGDTVSFKYQAPGEPMDPDSLVAVCDDDDLQELYEEYAQALHRPGTPLKTFRIKVFVQPALQFETEYTEGAADDETFGTEDMDISLEEQEEDEGINFDSWCSDDASYNSNVSAQPPDPHAHLVQAQQQQQQLQHGAAAMGPCTADAELPAWTPRMESRVLNNIAASLHRQGTVDAHDLGAFTLPARSEFTAEDFCLEDPYHEQDDDEKPVRRGFNPIENTGACGDRNCPAPSQPAAQHAAVGQLKQQQDMQQHGHPMQQDQQPGPKWKELLRQGESLKNRPLDRVRDGASCLPSHISAFGDASHGSTGEAAAGAAAANAGMGAGGSNLGSVKLPSHISAFGEGMDTPDDIVMENLDAHKRQLQQQRGAGGKQGAEDARGMRRVGSKCITQEFQHGSSLLAAETDGAGDAANDFNFQLAGRGKGNLQVCLPDGFDNAHHHHHHHSSTPKLLQAVAHVPRERVVINRKVGEGAFGEVSQATVFPYGSVAIKWLKRERFAKYSESFQKEAEVLARLNHPNIIRMYGLVTEESGAPGSGTCIIGGIMTEFMRGGSLSQRLRAMQSTGQRLTLRERCALASQATMGMAYLHDQRPAVIHFDLKPDNLLVQGEGEDTFVKVADFGLSKHKFQSYVSCRDLRGTLPYMAPELVSNPTQVCEKCDVWSMGVVMWEMFTLEVPFQELSAQQILVALMNGTLHLRKPPDMEPEWAALIEHCMEPNPANRPAFSRLAALLQELQRRAPAAPSPQPPPVSAMAVAPPPAASPAAVASPTVAVLQAAHQVVQQAAAAQAQQQQLQAAAVQAAAAVAVAAAATRPVGLITPGHGGLGALQGLPGPVLHAGNGVGFSPGLAGLGAVGSSHHNNNTGAGQLNVLGHMLYHVGLGLPSLSPQTTPNSAAAAAAAAANAVVSGSAQQHRAAAAAAAAATAAAVHLAASPAAAAVLGGAGHVPGQLPLFVGGAAGGVQFNSPHLLQPQQQPLQLPLQLQYP